MQTETLTEAEQLFLDLMDVTFLKNFAEVSKAGILFTQMFGFTNEQEKKLGKLCFDKFKERIDEAFKESNF